MIKRTKQYLWSAQSEDGSWKSTQYGVLRTGQALMPFILFTLLQDSEENLEKHSGKISKAYAFIHKHSNAEGFLGMSDEDIWEYPTYATAYALRCLVRSTREKDQRLASKMATALSNSQYTESKGFKPQDPAYGGWGFGGWRKKRDPGHMDLTHTKVVLQALKEASALGKLRRDKAKSLLFKLQNKDGGFFYSTVIHSANKGAWNGKGGYSNFGSYASASCEGFLASLACGIELDSMSLGLAKAWLEQNNDWSYPEGIAKNHEATWGYAMFYYHLAIRSEVFKQFDLESGWEQKVFNLLKGQQKKDGSFSNENPLMKEDDPLLSSTLALQAMQNARVAFIQKAGYAIKE